MTRPLGPQIVRIAAPRELVFDLVRVAYDPERAPARLRDKIRVLMRDGNTVLAEHRTKVGRFVAVTLETVRFTPPERIDFQLLHGPVSGAAEQFALRDVDGRGATELRYTGELATGWWIAGAAWGAFVAYFWERAVAASLADLKAASEQATAARRVAS